MRSSLDNGVHVSASPLEALVEKMEWLEIDPAQDLFGASLMDAGVTAETINEWTKVRRLKTNVPYFISDHF